MEDHDDDDDDVRHSQQMKEKQKKKNESSKLQLLSAEVCKPYVIPNNLEHEDSRLCCVEKRLSES